MKGWIMKYKSLKRLFQMYGQINAEIEYEKRLKSFSSYITPINIQPIQDQTQNSNIKYPLFFVLTSQLVLHLETVLNNRDKIKQLASSLPKLATNIYTNHLLINEIYSTNKIENIHSTKQEIAAAINKTKGYNKRFDGLVNQYIMMNTSNVEINSVSDIRKIFDTLVSSEISKDDLPDGNLFRKKGIGVYNKSKNEWVHRNEFSESELVEYLTLMLEFLKYFEAPQLYKIMASHFIFEYLHPFYDGNGRVGRYILAKLLNDHLDSFTALTFSYTVNNNKSKYYKAFEKTSNFYNKGELTIFIKDMLDLLIEGQKNIINTFEKNKEVLIKLGNSLRLKNLDRYENSIIFILLQDKVFGSKYSRISLKQLETITDFSRNKINDVIKQHEDKFVKLKSNPVVYEIKNQFIEELLSENND